MSVAVWTVAWSASAARAMGRLPLKVVDAVVAFVEGPLIENPYRVTKALHDPFEGKRSAHRGSYRVMIAVDDAKHVIRIFDVAHRADVYRSRCDALDKPMRLS